MLNGTYPPSLPPSGTTEQTWPREQTSALHSKWQQQQPAPPPPATNTAGTGMASSQTAHAVRSQNTYQPFHVQQQAVHQPQIQRSTTTMGPDRSIITAAGGITAIEGAAQVEKLPAETGQAFIYILVCYLIDLMTCAFCFLAKLFDRDPVTNEVLWFAAPPMNMSRARGPRYSLEYLMFIATKRKRREVGTETRGDGDGAEDEWERTKRPRVPTVTETMRDVWKEMKADGIHIEEGE